MLKITYFNCIIILRLNRYGGVVGEFVAALDDVQKKKFQSASDHVESANDYAMNCEEAFASRNVQENEISKGDNLVMYFSLSARVVINVLGETTNYTIFWSFGLFYFSTYVANK